MEASTASMEAWNIPWLPRNVRVGQETVELFGSSFSPPQKQIMEKKIKVQYRLMKNICTEVFN